MADCAFAIRTRLGVQHIVISPATSIGGSQRPDQLTHPRVVEFSTQCEWRGRRTGLPQDPSGPWEQVVDQPALRSVMLLPGACLDIPRSRTDPCPRTFFTRGAEAGPSLITTTIQPRTLVAEPPREDGHHGALRAGWWTFGLPRPTIAPWPLSPRTRPSRIRKPMSKSRRLCRFRSSSRPALPTAPHPRSSVTSALSRLRWGPW